MGVIGVAGKATKGLMNRDKEKEKKREEEEEGVYRNSRGEEISQNERTLNKVFKTIAQVIAIIGQALMSTLGWVALAILVFIIVGIIMSWVDEIISQTNDDTDTAILDTVESMSIIVNDILNDEEFVNEIREMANSGATREELYDRIEEKLVEKGANEDLVKDMSLQDITAAILVEMGINAEASLNLRILYGYA